MRRLCISKPSRSQLFFEDREDKALERLLTLLSATYDNIKASLKVADCLRFLLSVEHQSGKLFFSSDNILYCSYDVVQWAKYQCSLGRQKQTQVQTMVLQRLECKNKWFRQAANTHRMHLSRQAQAHVSQGSVRIFEEENIYLDTRVDLLRSLHI